MVEVDIFGNVPFEGVGGAEKVVDDIGGNGLNASWKCVFVTELKINQQREVIGTKL